MSTSSLLGAVRGGGRMYIDSPLAGYTEEEMVAEARNRQAHNRQRRRMKQTSESAADRGIACPPHVDPTNLFAVRTGLYNDCCDLAMDNNEDGERLEKRATALRQLLSAHKVFHVQ